MNTLAKNKLFKLITTLFIAISLCDILLLYKTVHIGPFLFSGGSFIMPFYYYLTDVITEVYGYRRSTQATWIMFLSCIILASFVTLNLHFFPNHATYGLTHIFKAVFGGTLITVLIATFVNSYIVSKWKILVHGKHFWMRSLGATIVGEAIEIFLEVLILYTGFVPFNQVISMILPTLLLHIILNIIIVFLGSPLVNLLKIIEGKDVYDYGVSFNPFKLTSAAPIITQNSFKTGLQ